MKNHYYILLILIIFVGCTSYKGLMVPNGNHNQAIQNAIYDFMNTKWKNNSDVFNVSIEEINNDVWGISILESIDKVMPDPDNKIGTSHPNFPTRYIEQDGKLFYWYDSTSVLSIDIAKILSKYNHIDSLNVDGLVEIRGTIDDSMKGVDYYFCKSNLMKYKKVITRVGMGHYEIPKMICTKKD